MLFRFSFKERFLFLFNYEWIGLQNILTLSCVLLQIVLSALCAMALGSPVSPVLLPKVQVAPAQVTVVKQPYTITEPEPVLRNVPVPYRAVAYTEPHVVPGPVLTPAVVPAPYYTHAAYAPAPYLAHPYVAGPAPIAYAGHSVVV